MVPPGLLNSFKFVSDKNIAIGNYAMNNVTTLAATENVFIGYGSVFARFSLL